MPKPKTKLKYTKTEQDFIRSFHALCKQNHKAMRDNGFWDDRDELIQSAELHGGQKLKDVAVKMVDSQIRELMVSEIGEATEGARKDLMDDHLPDVPSPVAEIADVIIRAFDWAGYHGHNLAEVIIRKMHYNKTRPHKHGKKF